MIVTDFWQSNEVFIQARVFCWKYITCKNSYEFHSGPEWCIFDIFITEDNDDVIPYSQFVYII